MTASVAGIHLTGTHGARPAGNTVPDGSLYSCTTHGLIYQSSYGGNSWSTWSAWQPMTAVGDLIQGAAAGLPARLGAGTAGQFLMAAGAAASLAWASRELDYVQFTSNANLTATTEATANTVVTSSAVSYDGATVIMVEFFTPAIVGPSVANSQVNLYLYDGASSIGLIGQAIEAAAFEVPAFLSRRLTPSNASHTYSIRGSVNGGTGIAAAGAGGSTAVMPGFIRITRAV